MILIISHQPTLSLISGCDIASQGQGLHSLTRVVVWFIDTISLISTKWMFASAKFGITTGIHISVRFAPIAAGSLVVESGFEALASTLQNAIIPIRHNAIAFENFME